MIQSPYIKTMVAAVMAVLMALDSHFGWKLLGSEDLTLAITGVVGTLLAWLLPNR